MAISTFRVIAALHTLQQFLEERELIRQELQNYLDNLINEWGIKVESFFIKDLVLPANIQQALSSAAVERNLAIAKIIGA